MESVQVAVRVRPLVSSEIVRGCNDIVQKTVNEPQVIVRSSSKSSDMYTFNHVFGQNETQEMIYSNAVKPLVLKLLKGYNVTILAYGQTGSGKTHTMGTAFDGNLDSETVGVIPRAITDIFDMIESMPDHTFEVRCSFMELYQEQLYDFLSTKNREQNIVDIREDNNKEIVIPNLTEVSVSTIEETTGCLIKGSEGRAVGSTAMNESSSRSNAVFTITVHMMNANDPNSSTKSKFHLVDLAGSERSKKTKATGDRFKEGVKINQGLLALGNVIAALGGVDKRAYIGYRDSKLTRLLQDSLGGNLMTLMIACISPADYNIEETINTLRYADRTKQIKNKPIVNQDPKAAEINRMAEIIQKLRMELLAKDDNDLNENISNEDCPAELVIQSWQIKQLKGLIIEMEGLTQCNNKTLIETNSPTSKYDGNLFNSTNNDTEISKYTSKQIGIQGELEQMKSELHIKEELLNRYLDNLTSFDSLNTNGTIKNFEEIILKLEEEKEELKNTLKAKTSNISAKLAEERRKRVLALEQEIAEMKKKNLQQAQILKQRDQQVGKIDSLQKEIHAMKSQIQLIRTMKSESERFRQWKLQRDKELTQLKAKDRKLENEIAKKEMLHDKQKNVLKRRVDESLVTIKRLKNALDKSKNNKKTKTTNGKVEHVKGWVEEEMEVILSVIDAKQSLEQLLEDRSVMSLQLAHLKKIESDDQSEIVALQEDIEMRNAQISDLRDKIATSNIETKVQVICEGLHSMPETKAAVKYLFNRICDFRMEFVSNYAKLQDLRSCNEIAEMKRADMEEQQKSEIRRLIEQKHKIERDYEEKISVRLRQLNSNGNRNSEVAQIQENAFENLRLKNDLLEEQIKKLTKEANQPRKIRNKRISHDSKFTISLSNDSGNTSDKVVCKCKTDCKTLRCSCRKNGGDCSDNCGCSTDCTNKALTLNSSSFKREISEERSNEFEEPHTPKKTRLTADYEDDITITPYPYNAKNKRKPLIT